MEEFLLDPGVFGPWSALGLLIALICGVAWVINRSRVRALLTEAELSARVLQVDEAIEQFSSEGHRPGDLEPLVRSLSTSLVKSLGVARSNVALSHIRSGRLKACSVETAHGLLSQHKGERCIAVCGCIYLEESAELIVPLPSLAAHSASSAVLWYLTRHPEA